MNETSRIATPTIITVQGPGHNEIQYLEDLSLSAVIALKFNIDEAKQRHPASSIHYASYIKKDITLKLQTFASCCEGFTRHAYSGSTFSTCLLLSELSDEYVFEIILMNILPKTANGVRVKLMQHTGYFPSTMPSLDNAANGILKLLMDRVHPESIRNNILTTHKIGPNYTHPEQYFVPLRHCLSHYHS